MIAPDYPGYGNSSAFGADEFDYTFDHLANLIERFTEQIGLPRYSICLMDYGAPIDFRPATRHPERVQALVIQNGNAYNEGIDNVFWEPIKRYWAAPTTESGNSLRGLLTLEATKWQYTHGVRTVEAISLDTWDHVPPLLDRRGNQEIQLDLFYSYGSNPPPYPQWQEYPRTWQPSTLTVWGKSDRIFPAAGAYPYRRDLPQAELHLLDTGHFVLEEDGSTIARLMLDFPARHLDQASE